MRLLIGTILCGALALCIALPAGAVTPAERPPGQERKAGPLGANYNQDLASVDFRELKEANASWLRGFLTMPQLDQGAPADNPSIHTMLEARSRGYSTALSLKFPYYNESFPAPGTPGMATEFRRLDKVLPLVMGKIGILVIGNEPFIESQKSDRDASLNEFYETIARYVIDYRTQHCGPDCHTALYMGALNRLDLPGHRTPAVERWMTFVRETPQISGVDIHPHVPDPASVNAFLDYILPRMRPDQTFLSTEFSLVWYWKRHLSDPAPAEFLRRYNFEDGLLVWQVIQAAIDQPFTEQEWADFLSSSPWFVDQEDYLCQQMASFRATGRLALATYGFRQDVPMTTNWGPSKPPWLLNSIYASHTVQQRRDGTAGRGYPWFDEFRALQHGNSCAHRQHSTGSPSAAHR